MHVVIFNIFHHLQSKATLANRREKLKGDICSKPDLLDLKLQALSHHQG